ncbi:MAG: polymerase subunit sigma-24 [Paenibacillaceae bacterium]|nr:polymerase subunit sigma-24 [Paenibacillaceae bacterium]
MHSDERTREVEALVHTFGKRLYAFCLRLAACRTDADDLYQQTFLRVLDMSRRIEPDNNPAGFLMAVAVRIWRDEQAKKARRYKIAPMEPNQDKLEHAADDRRTEQIVEETMLRRQVQDLVQKLPETLRVPVLLFYMGGLPVREIAEALDMPQGTVKSRLHQARQQLKSELGELSL